MQCNNEFYWCSKYGCVLINILIIDFLKDN